MTWIGKSFSWVLYATIAGVSAWTTFKVGQASITWEIQGMAKSISSAEARIKNLESGQLDLERKIFEKLSVMHGDIRRIEGKMER